MPESVENLEIWQRGVRLVKAVYEITRHWPSEEQYGLTSQIRRAAVSVPTNVAEGVGRGSRREIVRLRPCLARLAVRAEHVVGHCRGTRVCQRRLCSGDASGDRGTDPAAVCLHPLPTESPARPGTRFHPLLTPGCRRRRPPLQATSFEPLATSHKPPTTSNRPQATNRKENR